DALLAAALDDREGPAVLVTTIRSDFVARMGELPALERKLPAEAVRYYLRPMDEAGVGGAGGQAAQPRGGPAGGGGGRRGGGRRQHLPGRAAARGARAGSAVYGARRAHAHGDGVRSGGRGRRRAPEERGRRGGRARRGRQGAGARAPLAPGEDRTRERGHAA